MKTFTALVTVRRIVREDAQVWATVIAEPDDPGIVEKLRQEAINQATNAAAKWDCYDCDYFVDEDDLEDMDISGGLTVNPIKNEAL